MNPNYHCNRLKSKNYKTHRELRITNSPLGPFPLELDLTLVGPSQPRIFCGCDFVFSTSHNHQFNSEEPTDTNCLEFILGHIIEIHFFSTVTSPCCILNFPGQGLCTAGLKPSVLQTENLCICRAQAAAPGPAVMFISK